MGSIGGGGFASVREFRAAGVPVGLGRDGPAAARHTVVAGRVLVRDGVLTAPGLEERLRRHAVAAARIQGLA